MESSLKQKIVRSAKHSWDTDNLVEAGILLFERVPRISRPFWAADILEFASQSVSKVPEIQDIINFARAPEIWANDISEAKRRTAHNFFGALRQITLEEDQKGSASKLYSNILSLGENVAKVTYNAYGYDAPFDHDAGWWIVANLKSIVVLADDLGFSRAAWKVLTNEQYIELERPTRCNPNCGTCGWLKAFEIK